MPGIIRIDPKARSFRLFIDYYYGRDYMNIRYDDIISAFHTGFSFSLLRYRPPRFNPLKGIKEVKTSRISEYKKSLGNKGHCV